jgi:hypothetical protein
VLIDQNFKGLVGGIPLVTLCIASHFRPPERIL